jgi:hydrogenase maturation protease
MTISRTPAAAPRILLLGVGNVLWADEGFGVRCVEAFAARYETPDNVSLVDGGTQGLYLVDLFRDHDHIILFDAVDFGDGPGVMRIVHDDEVPSFISARKMSLHQTGVHDVLVCAEMMGAKPHKITLIGVQPKELDDYGGSLRACVRAQIEPALDIAVRRLADWGVTVRERAEPRGDFGIPALAIDRYELERPSAEEACRVGDERILVQASEQTRDAAE